METNPFINVISGKGRGHPQQGGTKPTRKCEFCGRLRQTTDSCFQKNNINPTKCTHCDRVGHSSDVCYTKFGYPPGHPKYPGKPRPFNNRNTFSSSGATTGGNKNNVTASSSSDVAPTLINEGERKDVSTMGQGLHITMAQFQQLMSLLNKAFGSGGGNSEIPSRANLSHSNPNQSHNSGLGKPNPDSQSTPPGTLPKTQRPNANTPSSSPERSFSLFPETTTSNPNSISPEIQTRHTPTPIVVPPPCRSERDTHPPPYLSEYQYKLPSLKFA
ncbi:hypothetical protein V8G54_037037 [Vigna mungo]|uniref:Uncharacterized protein n=1 Tax=Vigna mungo TaxID=3915 RepID=A0AAQ3MIS4_VIGMU